MARIHTAASTALRPEWLIWAGAGVVALLLALAPLSAVVLVGLLALALAVAYVNPALGLYAMVLSVPVQDLVRLPGGLSLTQAATVVALAAWLIDRVRRPSVPLIVGRVGVAWAVLLWALLLSTSFTPYSQTESIKETLRWVVTIVAWLLAANTTRTPRDLAVLLGVLLLAPGLEALVGVVQFLTGNGPPSFRIAANLPFVRAYGTIGTPNAFAGYMNMSWPLALALAAGTSILAWRKQMHWWVAAVCWLAAGLLLGGLLLSFSRGAWLGAALGVAGLIAFLDRRVLALAVVVSVVGGAALAFGGVRWLPDALEQRVTSIVESVGFVDPATIEVTPANFSKVERLAQMKAGWQMFADHPLTGVGPGNYTAAYIDRASAPWYVSRGHAHNYYLHMAAQAGIIGLIAYLGVLVTVAVQAVRTARRTRDVLTRSIVVGCCGLIAAVAGHNMLENLHALNLGIQLAAAWALVSMPLHEWRREAASAL